MIFEGSAYIMESQRLRFVTACSSLDGATRFRFEALARVVAPTLTVVERVTRPAGADLEDTGLVFCWTLAGLAATVATVAVEVAAIDDPWVPADDAEVSMPLPNEDCMYGGGGKLYMVLAVGERDDELLTTPSSMGCMIGGGGKLYMAAGEVDREPAVGGACCCEVVSGSAEMHCIAYAKSWTAACH